MVDTSGDWDCAIVGSEEEGAELGLELWDGGGVGTAVDGSKVGCWVVGASVGASHPSSVGLNVGSKVGSREGSMLGGGDGSVRIKKINE